MSDHNQATADIDIAANLSAVGRRIDAAAQAAGRPPASVTLVAVSKTQSAERIAVALRAGQRVFGENRVQEAKAKWPALKTAYDDCQLHLIGPLQTNKVKEVLGLFDVIETLDRPRLAEALARHRDGGATLPRLYVQVNTGEEPQKAGLAPGAVAAFLADCRDRLGLAIDGLMCIPPLGEEPAPHFALLDKLARRHDLAVRSMGMSGDYDAAIGLGSTHVRVGTAIFGQRPPLAERAPAGASKP